ncbi:MAG: hypothetical protein KTR18_05345 [Acidiferrobacterales bacterium]|nr:hypothetical protein [Acidiferrobacterales bacterium]
MIPIPTLAKICLFLAKPQDLPASRQLLVITIASAVIVLFVCYSALPGERNIMPLSIVHILAMGVVWVLLLKFHNQLPRWYQSATALFGCSSLINLAQLPIVLKLTQQAAGGTTQPTGSTAMLVLTMWIWEIAVVSSIIQQTLEVRKFTAVVLSLTFTFAIHIALFQFFGQAQS